jgi:hypothetical protein
MIKFKIKPYRYLLTIKKNKISHSFRQPFDDVTEKASKMAKELLKNRDKDYEDNRTKELFSNDKIDFSPFTVDRNELFEMRTDMEKEMFVKSELSELFDKEDWESLSVKDKMERMNSKLEMLYSDERGSKQLPSYTSIDMEKVFERNQLQFQNEEDPFQKINENITKKHEIEPKKLSLEERILEKIGFPTDPLTMRMQQKEDENMDIEFEEMKKRLEDFEEKIKKSNRRNFTKSKEAAINRGELEIECKKLSKISYTRVERRKRKI